MSNFKHGVSLRKFSRSNTEIKYNYLKTLWFSVN